MSNDLRNIERKSIKKKEKKPSRIKRNWTVFDNLSNSIHNAKLKINHHFNKMRSDKVKSKAKAHAKKQPKIAIKRVKRKQMSLEDSMILSLILGIIVVIITLIVAKPEPETFTEVWIEDFKELPKFANLNEEINFDITIVNHEKDNFTYNYSVLTELYDVSYCNQPRLYMTDKKTKTYHLDPAQIIKEDNYVVSFSYSPKGEDTIVRYILNDKHNITFDEANNKILYNDQEFDHEFKPYSNKRVTIHYEEPVVTIYINDNEVAKVDYEYDMTHSYFDFEIVDGYATFFSIRLTQNDKVIYFSVHDTDKEYNSTAIVQDNYFLDLKEDIYMTFRGDTHNVSFGNQTFVTPNVIEFKDDIITIDGEKQNITTTSMQVSVINDTYSIDAYTNDQHKRFYFDAKEKAKLDLNELIKKLEQLGFSSEQVKQKYLESQGIDESEFNLDYVPAKDSFAIITIDDINVTIKNGYIDIDGEKSFVKQKSTWNNFKVLINTNITITHNDEELFAINNTGGAIPLIDMNVTGTMSIRNAVLKNEDFEERFEEDVCTAKPKEVYEQTGTLFLEDEQNKTLSFETEIEDSYDYAKVVFKLDHNDQDVYFWVMEK